MGRHARRRGICCGIGSKPNACGRSIAWVRQKVSRDPGYADCDGTPANGCEIHLDSDPNNCGTCGGICSYPNASG